MDQRKLFSQFVGGYFGCFYLWSKTSFSCIKFSLRTIKRLRIIGGGYPVSAKEFDEVKKYWKKYGVRPHKYWYKLFADRPRVVDPRYIPDTMWHKRILPYYNNLLFMRAYTDKGMLDRFLPMARLPHTVIKNIAGIYYDDIGHIISSEEAEKICKQYDCLIFKPSIDSGAGLMIHFYDKKGMDDSAIRDYFHMFVSNFVVQEIVSQHPDLAAIHSKSLNTIRVISFLFKGEVHILSAQLRMGAGDARIDNYTAGGIACAIKDDGWLEDEAVTKQYTWTDVHPSGIKFNTIKVPSYDRIIEEIKQYHPMLPHFCIIGWDFAVDASGNPVVVEFNVTPAQNEIGSKSPAFGELTEEVLTDVFITKKLKNRFS